MGVKQLEALTSNHDHMLVLEKMSDTFPISDLPHVIVSNHAEKKWPHRFHQPFTEVVTVVYMSSQSCRCFYNFHCDIFRRRSECMSVRRIAYTLVIYNLVPRVCVLNTPLSPSSPTLVCLLPRPLPPKNKACEAWMDSCSVAR